jgi:selenocysteine lyase/cysteine desulfurase
MNADDTAAILETFNPRVRARFPMIDRDPGGRPRTYLNTGAGSLTVDAAAEAARDAQGRLNPMPGVVCPGEAETAALHARVRDLRGVLSPDANLVVTDLDHMANVSPWETVFAEGLGREVRRARVTPEGTLDVAHLLSAVDARTGLVALTSASNGTGSVVRLREVVSEVRRAAPGCLVAVDAVHHAPHGPLDVRESDVDFLVFSGYKVFGPMLGVLWGRAEHLEKLRPYRVETNKPVLPNKLEMGMLNNASLASLEAALSYLLWLADLAARPGIAAEDRASRFRSVMGWISAYEAGLSRRVLEGFRRLPAGHLACFGIADPERCGERVPTFSFDIAGLTATRTKERLWTEAAIQIADGNHYSAAVYRHLGRPEGICRASFAHYDNAATVDRFLEAVARLR